jgi:L-lactate dehydrogenase complex protein LldE
MADEKLRALDAALDVTADADLLVGCDTSCLMHLQSRADAEGRPVHVRHLAEVLADALPEADERGTQEGTPE